jgi:hypothetical protein
MKSSDQPADLAKGPLPPQKDASSKARAEGRRLDFIIIGAQKSGTTSLYKYLQGHPELYLLPEKEAPFFNYDPSFDRGWDWFAREYFTNAPTEKLWGKATPGYMADARVPQRIAAVTPEAKLIVLLRNPIDRAYSHYRMQVKRDVEKRSFRECLEIKLRPEVLAQERLLPPGIELEGYFAMGEYGRILGKYLELFPRNQLLVLFTEDLEKDPRGVLRRVLRFLKVAEYFVPANIGKRYHVGGTQKRIAWTQDEIMHHRLFQFFVKRLPASYQKPFLRRFFFWFKIWNTRPDPAGRQMPTEIRERLREFYAEDMQRLNQLLDSPVPWEEFQSCNYGAGGQTVNLEQKVTA